MNLYVDEAVVLRTHKLGEADRIISLLTRQHGRIRAVAKGVRRTTSRFGARLEPCGYVHVQLAKGRSLDVITQVETREPYAQSIGSDYARYTTATAMLETAERLVVEEHEPATQQFGLLVGGLRALVTQAHDTSLILDSYLLRSLAIAGYAPSFAACARCGVDGPHRAFAPAAGGMVCGRCRPAGVAMPAPETVELLAALLTGDWSVADASEPRSRKEATGLVAAHLHWHLEHGLRSLSYVERAGDRASGVVDRSGAEVARGAREEPDATMRVEPDATMRVEPDATMRVEPDTTMRVERTREEPDTTMRVERTREEPDTTMRVERTREEPDATMRVEPTTPTDPETDERERV